MKTREQILEKRLELSAKLIQVRNNIANAEQMEKGFTLQEIKFLRSDERETLNTIRLIDWILTDGAK